MSLPEVGENMQHAPTLDYRSMASIEIPRAVQGTTAYIYIYGSPPPPGPTWRGGNVSLTKCGVEYIQRHAQKTL